MSEMGDYSIVDGFSFSYIDQTFNAEFPKDPVFHYHNAYEIMFILDADNTFFMKDVTYVMNPMQLVIIPPFTIHKIYYKNDTRYRRYVMHFEHDYLLKLFDGDDSNYVRDELRNWAPGVLRLEPKSSSTILGMFSDFERYSNFNDQEGTVKSKILVKIALAKFFMKINDFIKGLISMEQSVHAQDDHVQNDTVKNIITYINDNFKDNITLEKLEKEFFVNRFHLCHRFKEAMGMSIIDFVHIVRVAEAQRLLLQKNVSISNIYDYCGFNNHTHFYRVFKKVTNTTPKEYRSNNRLMSYSE